MKTSIMALLGLSTTLFVSGCGTSFSGTPGSSSNSGTPGNSANSTPVPAPTNIDPSQSNVVPVSVGCGYANEPCVTVTVCVPGTNTCQSIPNVLLDTGSYGLRLFKQVSLDNFNTLTNLVSLPLTNDPGKANATLAECVSYADGSSDWGPLATADVGLGRETAPAVPIQIIDATFATTPSGCSYPDVSPIGSNGTGFNGILGVGLFVADCGPGCAPGSSDAASSGIYFSCPSTGGGACSGVAVSENQQTSNPVVFLATDNNGVILELPAVASSFGPGDGAGIVNGYLLLGIGTQANNQPGGATAFPTDGYGNFTTIFNGVSLSNSFIDSGSNGLYFPAPATLATCTDNTSFYCPSSEVTLSATMQGAAGTQTVSFVIGNSDDDFSQTNPNVNFSDLGGVMSSGFDWGLPFFYGRNVVVAIEAKETPLGVGPLWAF